MNFSRNIHTRFFIGASLASLVLFPARAAESAPAVLTIDQAISAALLNNLGLKSASAQSRIRERAKNFSFNKFYPSVSVTAAALALNKVPPIFAGP